MPMSSPSRRLTAQLVDLVSEIANLFQAELRVARAELSEKLSCAARGSSSIAIGAALAIGALIILLLAVVRWLAVAGIPEQWGLLIVGVVVAGAAVALMKQGADSMKGTALVPMRSIEQVRADVAVVKEHV
jgi:hypothetical protein